MRAQNELIVTDYNMYYSTNFTENMTYRHLGVRGSYRPLYKVADTTLWYQDDDLVPYCDPRTHGVFLSLVQYCSDFDYE